MAENNGKARQRRPTNLRKSFKLNIAKSISNLLNPNNHAKSPDAIETQSNSSKEIDTLSSPGFNNDAIIQSRLNSISETASNISVRSVEADIEPYIKNLMLEFDERYDLPVLIPNDMANEQFFFEGYITKHNTSLSNVNQDDFLINQEEIIQTNRAYVNYSKYFYSKEHFNFIGRYEHNESLHFVLSVRYENEKFECIFRNKDGNQYEEIYLKELDDSNTESTDVNSIINQVNIFQIFKRIIFGHRLQELKPIIHPLASQMINSYDKNLLKNTFTFGIIYQKFGQSNEREIFGNSDNSKDFDEFLNFIGQRVTLKNFNKFRGMLDTKNDDTGKESVYEVHDDSEIMFHVSTLLPASSNDHQYIERKRHIGNDRVAIVFQDQDTPFSPRMIKSKLLHVFIIVQPVKINNITKRYKISCILKKDVNFFPPYISQPCIFEKDENLKRFLLSKLINAEFASLKAPAFSSFSEQTIKPGLFKLCSKLNQLTFNFTWLNDPGLYNYAYLNQIDAKNDNNEPPFSVNSTKSSINNQLQKNISKPVKFAFEKINNFVVKEPETPEKEEIKDHFFQFKANRRLGRKSSRNDMIEAKQKVNLPSIVLNDDFKAKREINQSPDVDSD